MALAARSVSLIQQRLRPSASAEFISGCNLLNTTLSMDCIRQLDARLKRSAVVMIVDLIRGASKGTLLSSRGQDSLLLQALCQWLNDDAASRDVLNALATVS
jgi:hypothetical protein